MLPVKIETSGKLFQDGDQIIPSVTVRFPRRVKLRSGLKHTLVFQLAASHPRPVQDGRSARSEPKALQRQTDKKKK